MRRQRFVLFAVPYLVSIHAPVKDATSFANVPFLAPTGFNPRTRKGCDINVIIGLQIYHCFNPRTRKGCDPIITRTLRRHCGFNPRTRKGCDTIARDFNRDVQRFNPRTRKGCDFARYMQPDLVLVSIHAPVKDATNPGNVRRYVGGFNPRTRKGCDPFQRLMFRLPRFQSTHP